MLSVFLSTPLFDCIHRVHHMFHDTYRPCCHLCVWLYYPLLTRMETAEADMSHMCWYPFGLIMVTLQLILVVLHGIVTNRVRHKIPRNLLEYFECKIIGIGISYYMETYKFRHVPCDYRESSSLPRLCWPFETTLLRGMSRSLQEVSLVFKRCFDIYCCDAP